MKKIMLVPITAVLILTACSSPTRSANQKASQGDTASKPASLNLSFSSIASGDSQEKKNLHGAGGTFPKPLYDAWFAGYKARIGVDIKYDGIGSGAGIKAISNQAVDFGASDAALSDAQLASTKGGELFHVPIAFGAIVLAYDLPDFNGQLKLTPDLIASIYLGKIRWWDDPAITNLNPQLGKRHFQIVPIHRSDGSGTTAAFTSYLSGVSDEWRQGSGSGTSVTWPIGYPSEGNDGVAAKVQLDRYSIGYVELGFALKEKLTFAAVRNKSGNFITPDLASTIAAAASATASSPTDLRLNVIDPPGPNAYPICTATYLLLYHNYSDKATALALARLGWWMTHDAQSSAGDLNYARVPANITAKSESLIKQIGANGSPVLRF